MNIREQEYVLAIAKHCNIKNAAEELNISSPGLSIFLSSLENNLGIILFHRIGKKFLPTDAGNLYIDYAKRMANFKKEFNETLSDIKHGTSGMIHIGLHPRRTTFMLAKALKLLYADYPYVGVTITEETSARLFDLVEDGELDFIIVNKKHSSPVFAYEWLYGDRLVCVLPPSHPMVGKGEKLQGERLEWLDLKLLEGEKFILQSPPQSSRMFTDMALNYAGVKPDDVIIVRNLESASQIAAEGLGVAFNFRSYTRNFTYPKPVKYFLAGDPKLYVNYWIVTRKDKYMPKYAKALVEAFKESLSEERSDDQAHIPVEELRA